MLKFRVVLHEKRVQLEGVPTQIKAFFIDIFKNMR
jgi:hypothetical protein